MSVHKYSPVGRPSTPSNKNKADSTGNEENKALSRLLLVAPMYKFLSDHLLRFLPRSLVTSIVLAATLWRRFMAYRPIRAPLLNDITVAHMLLCLSLFWWLVRAMDLAVLQPTSHHSLSHSGRMASYAMAGAFLTANKSHSLISLVTGLSFERLMNFHFASALLTLWMSLLHGIQIAYWHRGDNKTHHHHDHDDHDHDDHDHDDHDHDDHEHHDDDHEHHRRLHHDSIHAYLGPDPNLWKFLWDGQRNSSGFVVLVALVVLVVTSVFHGVLRKWWFEGWFLQHVGAAIVVLVAGMVHGADAFWFVILWWGLDLVIRYGIMANYLYPRTATVTRVAENVVKVQWDKGNKLSFEAGQFVQVSIPLVQLLEFHPFSIASTVDDPHMTIYIRALPGTKTWTRNLYNLAAPPASTAEGAEEESNNSQSIRIFLEGPYGSVPPIIQRPDTYSMAVLISGGIGVTPCLSIAKTLIATNLPASSLKKIRYIWSIRDESLLQAIALPTLDDKEYSRSHTNGGSGDDGFELVERGHQDQNAGQPTSVTGANDDGVVLGEDPSGRSLTLQNEIYVTQGAKFLEENADDDQESASPKQEETDSFTIHRGRRLDVSGILSQIHREARMEGWGKVFVMGCGPAALLEQLEVACRRNQSDEVRIDFHQEIFDY